MCTFIAKRQTDCFQTSKQIFFSLESFLIKKVKRYNTRNKKNKILFIIFISFQKLPIDIFARGALYTRVIFADTNWKCSQSTRNSNLIKEWNLFE